MIVVSDTTKTAVIAPGNKDAAPIPVCGPPEPRGAPDDAADALASPRPSMTPGATHGRRPGTKTWPTRRCASSARWSRPSLIPGTKPSGTNSPGEPAGTSRPTSRLARPPLSPRTSDTTVTRPPAKKPPSRQTLTARHRPCVAMGTTRPNHLVVMPGQRRTRVPRACAGAGGRLDQGVRAYRRGRRARHRRGERSGGGRCG